MDEKKEIRSLVIIRRFINPILFRAQLLFLIFAGCQKDTISPDDDFDPIPVPEYAQRSNGDALKGYDYLVYGDYISSGFPLDFFKANLGEGANLLNRSGINAEIPYSFTAVSASNGAQIVAPNCLQCHAQVLNDKFILGLGNHSSDFTADQSGTLAITDQLIKNQYGANSPEWIAYEPFSKASKVVAPYIITPVKGLNPADKLTAVLAYHRNPEDLSWRENPLYEIPSGIVPTDVPPLWNVSKKNALYYTGSGRGDHARLITAAELLTMPDSMKAAEVDKNFDDVYEFLKNLEPPSYPNSINEASADLGKIVFQDHCAQCHGTYGAVETYPNFIIKLDEIGTDPELAKANFAYENFLDWYNQSWFNSGTNAGFFEQTEGYIAPPLDGIWATAPYLHNGSVPDLLTLLDSEKRPKFWQKKSSYNLEIPGWDYIEFNEASGVNIYNTELFGLSNKGHNYGDELSETERMNLIEYLKTL